MQSNKYYQAVTEILQNVNETQHDAMQRAADVIFQSLQKDGVLHIFGSGHSQMLAEEAFHRAGGLAPVNAMMEPFLTPLTSPKLSGKFERVSGIAGPILDYYAPRAGEVIIIISNSGINAVPIEMALESKKRGLTVIVITALAHSQEVTSRHVSGKKLFELADIVIDNCGQKGDAAIPYEHEVFRGNVCPTSTCAGIFIINTIVASIVERFLEHHLTPPVYISANLPEGDQRNKMLDEKYRGRIKLLG